VNAITLKELNIGHFLTGYNSNWTI